MEFVGWTEEWEIEKERNDCSATEAWFLTMFKNIAFEYDSGQNFTIYEGKCEFCRGKGVCAHKDIKYEMLFSFCC